MSQRGQVAIATGRMAKINASHMAEMQPDTVGRGGQM